MIVSTISSADEIDGDIKISNAPQQAKAWQPGKAYSHTELFAEYRAQGTKQYNRDIIRLQARVGKLLIATPSSFFSRDDFEKSIVKWQNTNEVSSCPVSCCKLDFSLMRPRQSHCRLCGRVVCKSNESCSQNCELSQIAEFLGIDPQGTTQIARTCADCQSEIQNARSQQSRKNSSMMYTLYTDVIQKNKVEVEANLKLYREIADLGSSSSATPARVKELRDQIYKGFGNVQAASQRMRFT